MRRRLESSGAGPLRMCVRCHGVQQRQMKAMASELNMFQAQVMEYKVRVPGRLPVC